jgi:HAE1 family hydrophobic/amphiphilic exporter-1
MKEILLSASLAVGLPALLSAEPLTRAEAVLRALEANPEVRKSQEDLKILEGRGQEAAADALPELKLEGSALRYRDPALLNSSSFDSFPPELRDSLKPIPANLYEGAFRLKQTVFSFKLGKAIRAARLAQDLGKEDVQRVRQAVALLAISRYDGYVLALEKVRVAEKAVRQKEKHLEMARNRRAAGVATDLDVLRSQVDLENQRTQLLRLKGQAELARGDLNAVMVRPIDTPIDPSDSLDYIVAEMTLDEAVREAWANRPEAKAVALSEKIYTELIGIAQSESRPSLDFNASWGYSVRKPSNFFESDFSKWNAGFSVTVPLFDGFRTAGKVAQARGERNKITQDKIALENQIRLEAKDAVERLNVAKSILDATQLNVEQAQKALDMTQSNYQYGAATTLDVTDAQAALVLAESDRIQALYDHAIARAALRYVMARDPLEKQETP